MPTLVTHWRPHADDLAAVALKKIYGGEKINLILVKDGMTPYLATEGGIIALGQLEKEGVEFVGIGRGTLDDHGKKECAATLMAEKLGVREAPKLRRLLDFVLNRDLHGGESLDLDSIISMLHNIHPEDPNKVRELTELIFNAEIDEAIWRECPDQTHPVSNMEESNARAIRLLRDETEKQSVEYGEHRGKVTGRLFVYLQKRIGHVQNFDLVDCASLLLRKKPDQADGWITEVIKAVLTQAKEFHVHAAAEYGKNVREEILLVGGAKIKAATAESSHHDIAKYCRHKGAAVVIKRDPETGHVQISRDAKRTKKPKWRGRGDLFTLRDVVIELRRAEQIASGIEPSSDIALSAQDGPNGAERWYYDPRMDIILNGSLTHPDIPATRLPFSEVERIVKETLKKA